MIFINQFENDKKNVNIDVNAHYVLMNYFNSYFMKSRLMKFKMCRKCKKGFFLRNKLYAHFKVYKRKNKNINKIVFNTKTAFIIFVTKIIIILINNNEIINDK